MSRAKLFSLISLVVISTAIVWGVLSISSPQKMRETRLDQHRINDMGRIVGAISSYVGVHGVVPGSLNDLDPAVRNALPLEDSETGEAYEYTAVGTQSFEICATFLTDGQGQSLNFYVYSNNLASEQGWHHDSGHQCFEFKMTERD